VHFFFIVERTDFDELIWMAAAEGAVEDVWVRCATGLVWHQIGC
jgi:hypothetical protein